MAALAQENLDFAEQTLKCAIEGGNPDEIASAQRERDTGAIDLNGIKDDVDLAIKKAHVNGQLGFDDSGHTWKCTECQHQNTISRDNIHASEQDLHAGGEPIGY